MKFKVYRNEKLIGTIFAPNYSTAFERAVKIYGLDIDIEEV